MNTNFGDFSNGISNGEPFLGFTFKEPVISEKKKSKFKYCVASSIKIKCIKNSREEKTIYQDLDGNIINVNDGNTFVNICPINSDVILEAPETTDTNNT